MAKSSPKNVFVSHVHEDDTELQDLKELLRSRGHDIRDSSIDSSNPNEASNPDYIKTEILAPRIRWAGTLVVLISPDTHRSEWVDWEIEYAHKHDKRIVGVWVRGGKDTDVPETLAACADAVVGWDSESVMAAITGAYSGWNKPDGTPGDERPIQRQNC